MGGLDSPSEIAKIVAIKPIHAVRLRKGYLMAKIKFEQLKVADNNMEKISQITTAGGGVYGLGSISGKVYLWDVVKIKWNLYALSSYPSYLERSDMATIYTHLELLPISDKDIESLKQMVRDEIVHELKKIENGPEVTFQTMDMVLKRIAELQAAVTTAASTDDKPSDTSENAI